MSFLLLTSERNVLATTVGKVFVRNIVNRKKVNLELFTDRITCSSCTNIINNVIHSSKYIDKTKNFNVELIKPDPIYMLKESIPIKNSNFYSFIVN